MSIDAHHAGWPLPDPAGQCGRPTPDGGGEGSRHTLSRRTHVTIRTLWQEGRAWE